MRCQGIGGCGRALALSWVLTVVAACGGGSGGGDASSQMLRNDNPITLSGSIGDGPVTGATVTVHDAHDQSVVAGVSDTTAGYQITVPAGTAFPITVTASGGTDLVSGVAPDFDLNAVLLNPTLNRVNVSPLSSLASAVAQCGGTLTNDRLANAWTLLDGHLSMGLDATRVPDPANGAIDASTIADVVLANEALGETLRRTAAALAGTSAEANATTLIQRIGCDLVDGAIDGAGTGADPRTSATFAAASASVMLEVIAGTLQVNSADAMAPMDDAIKSVLPGVDPSVTTLNVPVSDGLVHQARDALTVLMTTLPDPELSKFAILLGGTSTANARAAVKGVVTNADLVTLDGLAARVATSDDTQIGTITGAAERPTSATPPVVSFQSTPETVAAGATALLSWSSSGALHCEASGDWSGEQPNEGTFTTAALQTSQTFALSCVGLGGVTSQSATVQVASAPPPTSPVTTLSANPTSIATGGSAQLTWSATDATSCTASGGWSGAKAVSGTQNVGPLTASTAFSLACTGPGGTHSATATVTVQQAAAPPSLTLAASPLSVASGGNSTLSWSSTNATSCTASGGWSGTKGLSGSATLGPLTTAQDVHARLLRSRWHREPICVDRHRSTGCADVDVHGFTNQRQIRCIVHAHVEHDQRDELQRIGFVERRKIHLRQSEHGCADG